MVGLWCLCCMMMFRWTNKHPGIQKFWNLCGLYQDIYDWISPLNKRSGRPFILTQQSIGRNKYGISGHLHIFALLKHLMVLLRCNFSGLHFYTDSMYRGTCSSDFFFQVKTLLNDAFIKVYELHDMFYIWFEDNYDVFLQPLKYQSVFKLKLYIGYNGPQSRQN